jgi:hypothetical protein
MNVGVQFATSNSQLATQFAHAMDFWASIIDMQWYTGRGSHCSIQLFDGQPQLFEDSTVAKAHRVNRSAPYAWIAFNPKAPLTGNELYLTAVHEIGHLLGLSHNPDGLSVMFYTNRPAATLLDETDLRALTRLHKLRRMPENRVIRVTAGHGSPSPLGVLALAQRTIYSLFKTHGS